MNQSPLFKAHSEIFRRYISVLEEEPTGDKGDKLAPGHLLSLCKEACTRPDLPDDKLSRWLGFVQGVMISKGLLSVDEERDLTRPIFHRAYKEMGMKRIPSVSV